MKTNIAPEIPAPPSLMAALMAGFDAIASRVSLIVFPVALDLLIWLGPHLKLEKLLTGFSNQLATLSGLEGPESADMIRANQELWRLVGERLNLLSSLRAYPVGVPSLMAGRLPSGAPAGMAPVWELNSFLLAVGIWLGLVFIGLVVGAFYFVAVSEAATTGGLNWIQIARQWPRAALQVLLLTTMLFALLFAISIPASCMISAVALTNPSLGQFALLIYAGGLLWLLFPLLFSPHGIFIHHSNAWASLRNSIRVTRMTLPKTGIFFLAVLVISQGLDLLWSIPGESSWFMLVGILGHAFIATALLASSFVYYREADLWVHRLLTHLELQPSTNQKA